MLRYFTRKDSEFIKENGELVHERVRVIHSDGENIIVDDDGETYKIPIEYVNDTFNLFNNPYYRGNNLNERLINDFDIKSRDAVTPFSVFSRNPLELGGNHFFNTIFSKDGFTSTYGDDDSDDDSDYGSDYDEEFGGDDEEFGGDGSFRARKNLNKNNKNKNKNKSKRRVKSDKKLNTKRNKTRKK